MTSSKRSWFKAFAWYIGKVEGKTGPWIGVKVPVGRSWGADKPKDRDWNDETHVGICYFEVFLDRGLPSYRLPSDHCKHTSQLTSNTSKHNPRC